MKKTTIFLILIAILSPSISSYSQTVYEASGDGGSASATVNMSISNPKELKLAIFGDDGSLPNIPEFAPLQGLGRSETSTVLNRNEAMPGYYATMLSYKGALWTNADSVTISLDSPILTFIHESDPNSTFILGSNTDNIGTVFILSDGGMTSISNNGIDPLTLNTTLSNSIGSFGAHFILNKDSVDTTDRAGLYTASSTITATMP